MKGKILLVMLSLVLGNRVLAETTTETATKTEQGQDTIILTLEDVIALSLQESTEIYNRYLDVENASLESYKAKTTALPVIDYVAGYSRTENPSFSGDGGGFDRENYSHTFQVNQPVFQGGAIISGIDIAGYQEEKAAYTYEEERDNIRLGAIELYLNILEFQERMRVFQTSLESVEERYNLAKRQFELGLIAKSELLPFETRVLENKTRIIETDNQIKIALLNLKNDIGLRRKNVALARLKVENYQLDKIDNEDNVERARTSSKDIKQAELDVKITNEQEVIAGSEFLPKVGFQFNYGTSDNGYDDSFNDWEWNAGVNLSYNLFSFGKNVANYKQSRNRTKQNEEFVDDLRDVIEVKVRSLYLDLIRLQGVIVERTSEVEAAQENYRLESRRYEVGLINAIDLLDIESNLRLAELNLINAKQSYYLTYERYKDSVR